MKNSAVRLFFPPCSSQGVEPWSFQCLKLSELILIKFVQCWLWFGDRPEVDKQSFCIVVSSSESETEVITDESDSDWEKIDWAPAEYQTETESSVESGLSKRRRLSESWLADALSLGDHPRVSDLYSFMRRRETARIRKEMGLPPNQWYPAGDLMRTVFLTNVRREDTEFGKSKTLPKNEILMKCLKNMVHSWNYSSLLTIRDLMFIWNRLIMLILGVSPHQDDVTTRAVRVALQPALETWKELGPSGRHHLAGLVVFHCALWRTFGTKEFIRKLGFLESLETWKEESWQQVVDVALSCWERGELCFTEAYCPSRLWRKWEVGAFRDPKGKERVGSLFQDLFFFFFCFFSFFYELLCQSLFFSLSLSIFPDSTFAPPKQNMSRENLHLLPGSVSISAPWHLGASIRHRPGGWEWMLLATSGPSHHGGATLWWHRHHFLHQLSSRFFPSKNHEHAEKEMNTYNWSREKSSFSLKSLVCLFPKHNRNCLRNGHESCFGGRFFRAGFRAKELAEDLLRTPLFCTWNSANGHWPKLIGLIGSPQFGEWKPPKSNQLDSWRACCDLMVSNLKMFHFQDARDVKHEWLNFRRWKM